MIEPIRNLNEIGNKAHKGLHKRWLLQNSSDFSRMCDYMQKINFSIQDINSEIQLLEDPDMKDIVYVIILVVWIQEAFEKIEKVFRKDVMSGFSYSHESQLQQAKKFITAIRSFAVAHPLSTDRHAQYGFDGNYICIDIRDFKQDITAPFVKQNEIFQIDCSGLHANGNMNCDFYFYVYSEKDDKMRFFKYIGCNFEDIYQVARLYIDKLYALDSYLRKLKMNDFR